jgi:hypothetical protein
MQHNSALILLNRPLAGFGAHKHQSSTKDLSIITLEARHICVQNAIALTELLEGYEKSHGEAFSMSGVALHPISTAATILIAEIVDSKGLPAAAASTLQHMQCLKRCIKSLSEMDKSYPVARRVRKILQLIMRRSNVNDDTLLKQSYGQDFEFPTSQSPGMAAQYETADTAATANKPQQHHSYQRDGDGSHKQYVGSSLPDHDTMMPNLSAWDSTWFPQDLFPVAENMPMTSQMDIPYSFESIFGNPG